VVLVLLVAVFGTFLATMLPLNLLQLVMGLGLLLFGLSWLRKAISRAVGVRPYRDEAAAFERLVGRFKIGRGPVGRFDAVAYVAAFKGVFLEGLEAAIIAITFGAAQRLWVAFASAGVAGAGASPVSASRTSTFIRLGPTIPRVLPSRMPRDDGS
jgi:uncharacterized membrane protein